MDLVLDYEEGMLEEETQIGAEVELSTDDGLSVETTSN